MCLRVQLTWNSHQITIQKVCHMYFGFQELLWRVVASESHYQTEQNILVYAILWFPDQELTVT